MQWSKFIQERWTWVIGICALSFVTTLAVLVASPSFNPDASWKSDSYSRGALGHHAFIRVLRKMGRQVHLSRYLSDSRTGSDSVLVAIAPRGSLAGQKKIHGVLTGKKIARRTGDTIVVLSKYADLEPDPAHGGWIKNVRLAPRTHIDRLMDRMKLPASVARLGAVSNCQWTGGGSAKPELRNPQSIRSGSIRPVLGCGGDVLAGVFQNSAGGRVLVVSDPDLISNWSLGHGNNAEIAYHIFNDFARPGASFIVDETVHGHLVAPSLWRMMFEFPVVTLTAHALLLIVLALWIAAVRFGRADAERPALAPGAGYLIQNTAALLSFGGHSTEALNKYLEFTVREVARRIRAPRRLKRGALRRWLDSVGTQKGTKDSVVELAQKMDRIDDRRSAVAAHKRLRLARRIHRWKREMLKK